MRVSLFDYSLPGERIAQRPRARGSSRLLVLDRRSGSIAHRRFEELPQLLRRGDLLVRNDVKVRHARLFGADAEGRTVEVFLLKPAGDDARRWVALAKPGRRAKPGRTIRFPREVTGVVEEVSEDGKRTVRFDRAIDERLLAEIGHVPLPPYIRREPGAPDRPEDRDAYQTVFACEPLAVAAPTAGLHFTDESLRRIRDGGVEIVDLTLAVGAGTFKPVTAADTADHAMEPEEVLLPAPSLAAWRRARTEGRRVLAVGTTVARALEAAARLPQAAEPGEPLRFSTDLFITPGFEFRSIDALLTNFHLPRSTLLMLVSAFAGREKLLRAYEEAVREEYLFYSFGDAMLIEGSG